MQDTQALALTSAAAAATLLLVALAGTWASRELNVVAQHRRRETEQPPHDAAPARSPRSPLAFYTVAVRHPTSAARARTIHVTAHPAARASGKAFIRDVINGRVNAFVAANGSFVHIRDARKEIAPDADGAEVETLEIRADSAAPSTAASFPLPDGAFGLPLSASSASPLLLLGVVGYGQ